MRPPAGSTEAATLITALTGVPLQTLNLSSADQGNHLSKEAVKAVGEPVVVEPINYAASFGFGAVRLND